MSQRFSPTNPAHAPATVRATQALALLPLLMLGCASLPSFLGGGDAERSLVAPAARLERIAILETSIAQDHDMLETLVTGQREDSDGPLHKNEDLRAIAKRLSQNEDELEALLRAERLGDMGKEEQGTSGARATP